MRIAIVAEHVRRLPWHHGRWAIEIAKGLCERCEHIELICDAVADHSQLDSVKNLSIIERAPERSVRDRRPLRFQRWALDQLRASDADGTISLTRLVPAGLWLPVDPPSWTSYKRSVLSLSPATTLLEASSRTWIVNAMRAERRAMSMARSNSVSFCQLGSLPGPDSSIPTDSQPKPSPSSVRRLGLASTLTPDPAYHQARYRLREKLDLAADRPVLLCSLIDRQVGVARALVQAIARSRRSAGPPALLVLTRQPMRVHRLVSALGALPRVRILGASSQMGAIISACDAVALPATGSRGTARMIADAIAMHTPVIAAHGVAGAEIIEPSSFGGPPIGCVLNDVTPGGWQSALDQMLEPMTLQHMKASVASLAPTVRFESFVDRLLGSMSTGGPTPT